MFSKAIFLVSGTKKYAKGAPIMKTDEKMKYVLVVMFSRA